MGPKTKQPEQPQPCQITIQPVENGFVIQAINVTGLQSERRAVATNVGELRKRLHDIVDGLYESYPVVSEFSVSSNTQYSEPRMKQKL